MKGFSRNNRWMTRASLLLAAGLLALAAAPAVKAGEWNTKFSCTCLGIPTAPPLPAVNNPGGTANKGDKCRTTAYQWNGSQGESRIVDYDTAATLVGWGGREDLQYNRYTSYYYFMTGWYCRKY